MLSQSPSHTFDKSYIPQAPACYRRLQNVCKTESLLAIHHKIVLWVTHNAYLTTCFPHYGGNSISSAHIGKVKLISGLLQTFCNLLYSYKYTSSLSLYPDICDNFPLSGLLAVMVIALVLVVALVTVIIALIYTKLSTKCEQFPSYNQSMMQKSYCCSFFRCTRET